MVMSALTTFVFSHSLPCQKICAVYSLVVFRIIASKPTTTIHWLIRPPNNHKPSGVLVAQQFGRRTSDQAVVAGSIPSRGVTKAPGPTRPSIPPG